MSFSSIVKLFLPKDRVFYGLFEEVAGNLSQMADIFHHVAGETNMAHRNELIPKLEDLEHKNDDATHRIFIELGKNFITPFDREDIHYLATSLDDVADYIWGVAKRMVNYNIVAPDPVVIAFAGIIKQAVSELVMAIHELRNMKDLRAITNACVVINSLENEGDDLLDNAMGEMFASQISAFDLIKNKDLYQMLEIVTDKCEDAANVIETIIVKYA
jgi:predicted phosphate transport protein (TIGR00153 family)